MVHVCAVPGCSNRSDRETQLSYYHLPLKNKRLLKVWIHKIGRKNLPLNDNSHICSAHFHNCAGRCLRTDEYPSVNLPNITTALRQRKSPLERICKETNLSDSEESEVSSSDITPTADIAVQTAESMSSFSQLQAEVTELKQKLDSSLFRVSNISQDDQKIQFYTGFPNYSTLVACYEFLDPGVESLNYWGSSKHTISERKSSGGKNHSLPPMEQFFFILVRLRLGLFERDLVDRFSISVSTFLVFV